MTRYHVITKRGDEEVTEVMRTSKKAAYQDVELFRDILHVHAWVVEVEE